MAINERNSYINTFSGGMNSDTAYDTLDNKHYVYGKNIRITKNQQLGGYTEYATLHEGIVTPIPAGVDAGQIEYEGKILSVDSVDRMFVITTVKDKTLYVYRGRMDEDDNVDEDDFKKLWEGEVFKDTVPDKISTVLYKELENVTKLYIATGETPLMIIRVDGSDPEAEGALADTPADCLMNNYIMPQNRIYIEDKISGRLKTLQVQYTYRLYNKYANTTQLAPLTNKIQVIDPSRSKENGNAEDTETSVGFTLKVKRENYWNYFKRIQVYRLSYIKPGEQAEVSLIYDDNLPSGDFVINDIGIEPLQTLTIEEFGAMSGMTLIPQVIEQNQNYMFCGNVKDDTIIQDIKITPQNFDNEDLTYEFVCAKINLADDINGSVPQYGSYSFVDSDDFDYTAYFKQHDVNPGLAKSNYENIITSSLLRSLRRGEHYKYAIVFYDKHGRRTDVTKIAEVNVPEISITSGSPYVNKPFEIDSNNHLVANPVGVKIKIPKITYDKPEDIVGCQIIRRSCSDIYQKTLIQVALARPVRLGLTVSDDPNSYDHNPVKYSPYYPSGFLNTNGIIIGPDYYNHPTALSSYYYNVITDYSARTNSNLLFLIFSSEIDYRRDDVLNRLNTSDMDISEVAYLYANYKMYGGQEDITTFPGLTADYKDTDIVDYHDNIVLDRTDTEKLTQVTKADYYWVFNYFSNVSEDIRIHHHDKVKSVKDVKIPNWEDGFSNVQRKDDQFILSAIKKYKLFTTGIDSYTYNNWCSFSKYDLRAGDEALVNVESGNYWIGEMLSVPDNMNEWLNNNEYPYYVRTGYIGAGGSCMLLTTETDEKSIKFPTYSDNTFYTSICNITHAPKLDDVESDEQVVYYGFGNYFPIEYNKTDQTFYVKDTKNDTLIVFDGDIYITPQELTTMYKTYNFESADTLLSTQITNYVPLESKVNTYFDYGMNLRNTNSANLLYEPGEIDGITGQQRPAHQYNMIYSDNDVSNDVFTLISTDKNETNLFKQRAYFSEPKTNGEFIDNFPIFKAASFIDVDSQYGQITNMDTDRNNLYYWQDSAFGKFSVNERSLINDTNGNTIMLGQAGILSRYDYLSTKYGMRLHDLCSRTTENGLFWVDINNKAVVALGENGAINYGEQLFVQNIINNSISDNVPYVDYDILNNELLCKCLNNGEQLVFNTKYNIATSVYTRKYDNMIYIKNHLYSIDNEKNVNKLNYTNKNNEYLLHPSELQFVVNPSTSITKVFDSQQVVPITRYEYKPVDFDNVVMSFETDLYKRTSVEMEDSYTDREGNIIYNIPRFDQKEYGNRMRGKWMKVNMEAPNLSEYAGLSHVITKFRQSFS